MSIAYTSEIIANTLKPADVLDRNNSPFLVIAGRPNIAITIRTPATAKEAPEWPEGKE